MKANTRTRIDGSKILSSAQANRGPPNSARSGWWGYSTRMAPVLASVTWYQMTADVKSEDRPFAGRLFAVPWACRQDVHAAARTFSGLAIRLSARGRFAAGDGCPSRDRIGASHRIEKGMS